MSARLAALLVCGMLCLGPAAADDRPDDDEPGEARPMNPKRLSPGRDTRDVRKDLEPFTGDAPLAPRRERRDWNVPGVAGETEPPQDDPAGQ